MALRKRSLGMIWKVSAQAQWDLVERRQRRGEKRSDEGLEERADEGWKEHGDEGWKERGDEGWKEHGDEGWKERGDEGCGPLTGFALSGCLSRGLDE
jgi:hypothetical protein